MARDEARRLGMARSIASATAAVVHSDDLAGILVQLLDDCAALVGADAAGVMLLLPDGDVEVLSATSHEALQLELYQSQVRAGPCLECISTGQVIDVGSPEELRSRWPAFAAALGAAGLSSAHAVPLSWQGQVIGALNLFRRDVGQLGEPEALLARAFADITTIAVVHTGQVSPSEAVNRTRASLASRNIIEQAKGVLAYRDNLDMAAAYRELKRQTAASELTLTQVATEIMRQARQR